MLVFGLVATSVGLADPVKSANPDIPPAGTALPVTRVVLFNSGVGYFEHFGTVSDSAHADFSLQVDDVQDVLKTLIVQDLDDGKITGVDYPSRDPLAERLQVFSIDLTNPPTLGELLLQLRGEQVSVAITRGPGQSAVTLVGTIVGAEIRARHIGDQVLREEILTLLTEAGLQAVSLEMADSIKLLNEKLNDELRQALTTIAEGRSADQRTFTVHCNGEGERRIRVGYVISAPVWKTTYRLLLGEKNKSKIQGWAIVDNTSQHDWRNVSLSLVSGTPISFRMPLYDPLYVDRPIVDVAVAGQPNTTVPERGEFGTRAASGGGGGFGGGGLGGFAGGGVGGRGSFGTTSGRGEDDDAMPFNPAQGVAALAAGEQVGEYFQYQLDGPINVDRRKSATLPILEAEITVEKISIYSEKTDATRPLHAARINNTSDSYLMAGPVTVFEGTAFAGEAIIENLPKGSERFLTYAVDLGLRVRHDFGSESAKSTVSLQGGNVKIETPRRQRHDYHVTNVEQASRSLIIEHPRPSREWKIVEPKKSVEDTENFIRYIHQANVGETVLKVVETTTFIRQVALRDVPIDEVRGYLAKTRVDDNSRKDLTKFVQLHQQKATLTMQLSTLNNSISKLHSEQERIRKNMSVLDRTNDVYARYLKSFSEQEDQLLELQRHVKKTSDEIVTTANQMDKLAPLVTRHEDNIPIEDEDPFGGNGEDDPFGR
jgi:hypothetical protein